MEFRDVLYGRRSIRSFQNKPLTDAQLQMLLDAGIHAPNACNAQSWHFYVLTDSDKRRELAERGICAPWVASAPVIFILCADNTALGGRFGERAERFVIQDTALAAENMLLCAYDMGLGGCIIGSYQDEKCRSYLRIPDKHRIMMLLPIGYPDYVPAVQERKLLSDVVTYL